MSDYAVSPRERMFTLQWHLTARCGFHCKHCYMYESPTFDSEIRNELGISTILEILDEFYSMLRKWRMKGRINFTGGDPLLKKGFDEILTCARGHDIEIGILGNPISRSTAEELARLGVHHYQVSIDGLEQTHDRLRGSPSLWATAIRTIGYLRDAGISSNVMFTLSRLNSHELISVIRLANEIGVSAFDFSRLVPTGSGANLSEQMLTPAEYRELLLEVLQEYEQLDKEGAKTIYGRKENLWVLLYYELEQLRLPPNDGVIYSGCPVGCNILTILADGTILPCRRMVLPVGKLPDQNLSDIFFNSSLMNELREVERMEKCRGCKLWQLCRGCPAVAYAVHGSPFAPDPQCWKIV